MPDLIYHQRGIKVNSNSDTEKVFSFSKLIIKDMFREMKDKANVRGSVVIDIIYREVKEE